MAPVNHTRGSAAATAVSSSAVSGIGYMLLGAVTGAVVGGAALAAAAFGIGAAGTALVDIIPAAEVSYGWIGGLAKAAAIIGATIGGVTGGLSGGTLGVFSGFLSGGEKVSAQEQEYLNIQKGVQASLSAPQNAQREANLVKSVYDQGVDDMAQVSNAMMAQQQMQFAAYAQQMQAENAELQQRLGAESAAHATHHTHAARVEPKDPSKVAQLGAKHTACCNAARALESKKPAEGAEKSIGG